MQTNLPGPGPVRPTESERGGWGGEENMCELYCTCTNKRLVKHY